MPTKPKLLIGPIVAALALLGALYTTFARQSKVGVRAQVSLTRMPLGLLPSPTPEVLGNGWYRFTDNDAGYSISYPSDSYLDAQYTAGLDFKQVRIRFPISVGEANQEMVISVYSNSERLPLERIVRYEIYENRLPKHNNGIELTAVRIAGLDAAKLEMLPFFPAILVSAKSRVYFISLPMNMLWGNPPTQASVDLYYKIINTFALK